MVAWVQRKIICCVHDAANKKAILIAPKEQHFERVDTKQLMCRMTVEESEQKRNQQKVP